ncbi:hypothetical protein LCGC14_2464300, partial [marine sediment metagenome]
VILWDDFEQRSDQVNSHYRNSHSYDSSTTLCPQLVITYIPPAPTVTTNAPTGVYASIAGKTSTRLQGSLDATSGNTNIWFEWDYNTNYGNTVGSWTVTSTGPYTYDLTGFDPVRTVYYRFVAENDSGVTYGADQSFRTSGAAAYTLLQIAITAVWLGIGIVFVLSLVASGVEVAAVIVAVIIVLLASTGVQVILSALTNLW